MTKCCVVQTFLGDIFSDLPEVSNFATSDRATYKTDPKTPLQHYLRRDPPEWAADRYTRAENAVLSMASTQEDMAFKLKCQAHLIDAPLAVSSAMLRRHCFCNPQSLGNQQRIFQTAPETFFSSQDCSLYGPRIVGGLTPLYSPGHGLRSTRISSLFAGAPARGCPVNSFCYNAYRH